MTPLVTPFSAYKLSVEELQVARKLGPEQEAYFQTLLADAACEKIAIDVDPNNALPFIQQEAYLRGQMDILNLLLGGADGNPERPKASEAASPQPQPQQA